ncbi:NAD-dependent succinate-semialdehyde dehydrogenase [Bacillus sp. FJAT-49736]|uniref:NAD-dependent succinate-semialdehyde dehydrogenase n=1 Tax=Bacillus sp. FJAT-49736 TaxID=2833582 RepID=UPI001BC9C126|nr:NAD-dependent succinate-semialdehyde dehydrogenase [Bacillus sp. FJAT-49736]MBS4171801.1 NAD-dependent succinate-semialdehyde dehydrogenase [Bacillus sp. FJAT-49736]
MLLDGQYIQSIYIDGQWCDSHNGLREDVINPAQLMKIKSFSYGNGTDANMAVQAAKEALSKWAGLTARERSNYLYAAYLLMMEKQEKLARILTSEQGKPLAEARGEIASAASYLQWYAEEGNRVYGEIIPSSNKGKRLLVIPQPIGVVAAITPWNFPSSMITRKLGPALAAGCTVVLKPAEQTPLSAIELVKIFEEVGIPKGVLNLVTGDPVSIGKAFMDSPDVRLITFTGSTEVGKILMKGSADTVKKLSLELGGHAPIVIFEDSDLEQAVNMTIMSKFRNCGQTCICANRVYVQKSIQKKYLEKLMEHIESLKIGDGLEDQVNIGPLIDEDALLKVKNQYEDAISKGAVTALGGRVHKEALNGFFYEPTVLTNVSNDMKVMSEETFGPLLPVKTFETEEEVIQLANHDRYGLAAYIFTENINRAIRVMEKLEYGIVGINDVFPAVAEAPFGGMKQSGQGKEGGREGIMEYVEMKYVSMGVK